MYMDSGPTLLVDAVSKETAVDMFLYSTRDLIQDKERYMEFVNLIKLQPNFKISMFFRDLKSVTEMTETHEKRLLNYMKSYVSGGGNQRDYLKEILLEHNLIKNRLGNPCSIKLLVACVKQNDIQIDALYKNEIEKFSDLQNYK